jgi:iron-sulfur cluster assembly protein
MLTITQDAADAIARALEQEPADAGFRIAEGDHSTNGSGPALEMALAQAPEADDEVIDDGGVRLFVEPQAAETLDGKVLDAEIAEGEVRFALLEAD